MSVDGGGGGGGGQRLDLVVLADWSLIVTQGLDDAYRLHRTQKEKLCRKWCPLESSLRGKPVDQ